MADETKTDLKDSADAYAKAVDAQVEAGTEVVKAVTPKAAPKTAAVAAVKSAPAKVAKTAKKATNKVAKQAKAKVARPVKKTVRKAASKTVERIETMTKTNKTPFADFTAIPAFGQFKNYAETAQERSQDFVKKGQKVAEEMADLTRANVEAMVEAGRVTVEGVKSLGQDALANGRDNMEKAADAVRTLAEAKSPTEYMQLQGEFARASFDRIVADSSKMAEQFVKLAGEAFQPIQSRASANAEKLNTLVA